MSAENKVSAFLRVLTQLRSNFSKHPQRIEIAAAGYAFVCLTFVLMAVLAFDIAASVALAYLIGFAAIGVSALALHRLSAPRPATTPTPELVALAQAEELESLPEEPPAVAAADRAATADVLVEQAPVPAPSPTQRGGIPKQAATIKEVALAAGVSPMTVSRVLNESPKVREATKLAVNQAIAALGYSRNEAARALATGQPREDLQSQAEVAPMVAAEPASWEAAPLEEVPPTAPILPVVDEVVSLAADAVTFDRAPIVTLPNRKLGLIQGALVGAPAHMGLVQQSELLLAHAVAFATSHPAGQGRTLLVNLTVEALADQEFLNDALDILDSNPGLAARMIFALPESVLTSSEYGLQQRLHSLREEGMQFAGRLERTLSPVDFITHGSAWSGFANFLMPVHTVLESGEGVVELLQSLGVKLIATGVTSDEQVLELLDRKVPLASGPLFLASGKPVTATEKPKAKRKPKPKDQPAIRKGTKLISESGPNPKIAAEAQRKVNMARRPAITVPHGPRLSRLEKAQRLIASASGTTNH